MIDTKDMRSAPTPARWVWLWAGLVTLLTIAEYLNMRHHPFQYGGEITYADSGLWEQIALPMLMIMSLAILVTLAVCAWWYSRSKLLRRRSTILRFFGHLLFGLGTLLTSFGATNKAFYIVAYVSKGGLPWEGIPDSFSWGKLLPPLLSVVSVTEFALCALVIRIAYFLVFRSGSVSPAGER